MLDSQKIRRDFPLLNQPGKIPVYLDNACMSLRPQSVIDAVTNYYNLLSACAGRSNHHLAAQVHEGVEQSREKVRKFINASKKEEVIFTRNTTEGLNLLANTLNLQSGDVVVLSDKEHNSNLVPWLKLKQNKGIKIRIVPSNVTNEADISSWQKAIDKDVKVVSVVYTSNLDGVSNPVKDITALAHQVNAVMIVDGAQCVPHQPIDVKALDIDFLSFSLHKMCGPSGMGILYGKTSLLEQLDTFIVGGDTVERTTYDSYTMLPLPEKFEAGLQDYAGMIATGEAISYLTSIGMQSIHQHEIELNTYLSEQMSHLDRIHCIGPAEPEKRSGIYSFTVDGAAYHQIALMLDQVGNIQVRSGQHCVHSWFNAHDISGSVRASLYFYNTKEEIDHFIDTLNNILQVI